MEDIFNVINLIGFPIFVAVWMLIKDQDEKKQTREALNNLTDAIKKLTDK